MSGFSREIPHSGTMADHPTSETVEILGLNQATNGCSCPDHDNCGSVVKPDVVVTLMTRTMKTTTTTINHEAQMS